MDNYYKIKAYGIECRNIPGDQKVVCPKCSQDRKKKNDKCLSVNVEKGVWKCHNPGCDWDKGFGIAQKLYTKPEKVETDILQSAVSWLSSRGISTTTINRLGITSGSAYMPQVQSEVHTIQFNYLKNGKVVNIKYRDKDKNFKMVSGAELSLYCMDLCEDKSYVVICEGEMDAASYWEAGIQAVSVPNGASTGRLEYLDSSIDFLSEFKKVYIATDMDAPGRELASELARRLGKERCYDVKLAGKDANDVLMTMGVSALKESISSAKPYPLDGVHTTESAYTNMLSELMNGSSPGKKLNSFPEFSNIQSWRSGLLTVVTGIPGHGKSSFVDNLIVSLASELGWPIGIWSAEKPRPERHFLELYSIYLDKSITSTNFEGGKLSFKDIEDHKEFFNKHFYLIDTGANDVSVDGLLAKGKELVKRSGIKLLVLDNWVTIEHRVSGSTSKHDYSGQAISKMSLWCKQNECDIILVAHPKKMDKEGKKYRIPDGYDISDSSNFFNLPDNGLTVYRDFETGQTNVFKWKNRWREIGQVGTVYFSYNKYTGKFTETEQVNTGQSKDHFIGEKIKRFGNL
jgi:twinkle protein